MPLLRDGVRIKNDSPRLLDYQLNNLSSSDSKLFFSFLCAIVFTLDYNHKKPWTALNNSIESKYSALDNRISLLKVLFKEFQAFRHRLEYSQDQIDTLTQENKQLQLSILDLQTRSMWNKQALNSISEQLQMTWENNSQGLHDSATKTTHQDHQQHQFLLRSSPTNQCQIQTFQTKTTGSTLGQAAQRNGLWNQSINQLPYNDATSPCL